MMDSSLTTPESLIAQTHQFVREYMSKPPFDAPHNYGHVCRVLAIAEKIIRAESVSHPGIHYDPTIVALGALLHDVSDHKYVSGLVQKKKRTSVSLVRFVSRAISRRRKNIPESTTPLSIFSLDFLPI